MGNLETLSFEDPIAFEYNASLLHGSCVTYSELRNTLYIVQNELTVALRMDTMEWILNISASFVGVAESGFQCIVDPVAHYLWVIGGDQVWGNQIYRISTANITEQQWEFMPYLSVFVQPAAVTVFDDKIYVISGWKYTDKEHPEELFEGALTIDIESGKPSEVHITYHGPRGDLTDGTPFAVAFPAFITVGASDPMGGITYLFGGESSDRNDSQYRKFVQRLNFERAPSTHKHPVDASTIILVVGIILIVALFLSTVFIVCTGRCRIEKENHGAALLHSN